jgi:hypothetical protein
MVARVGNRPALTHPDIARVRFDGDLAFMERR